MNILTVVNGEANDPIHKYVKVIENELLEEVEDAFESLNIHVAAEIVEEIAYELEHDRNYWFNELYCFEIIKI